MDEIQKHEHSCHKSLFGSEGRLSALFHQDGENKGKLKDFMCWPTPKGWMTIICMILAGIGGTIGLTWHTSDLISRVSAMTIQTAATTSIHSDKINRLEYMHAIDSMNIATTKANTEEIKEILKRMRREKP